MMMDDYLAKRLKQYIRFSLIIALLLLLVGYSYVSGWLLGLLLFLIGFKLKNEITYQMLKNRRKTIIYFIFNLVIFALGLAITLVFKKHVAWFSYFISFVLFPYFIIVADWLERKKIRDITR